MTVPVIIVLITTTIPRLVNHKWMIPILSSIWSINNPEAPHVMMTHKNPTNFRGKNENDVTLLTASFMSLRKLYPDFP